MPTFYEFFAGGGMVRAGLGPGWTCLFANDFDPKKATSYARNWGDSDMRVADINALSATDLPGQADLMWGSFPCQDLSLAGAGVGLEGSRSGAFYAFWHLIKELNTEKRAPHIVAVENVADALTSNGGADFNAMIHTFVSHGYRPGAMVINADLFVPQSRPRLFIVGVRNHLHPSLSDKPSIPFHPQTLVRAAVGLPTDLAADLIWWRLPTPPLRNTTFADLIEDEPDSVAWHSTAQTSHLLSLMAPLHRGKVETAKASGRRMIGGVYRRTRRTPDGGRAQRAEVRFDDVAGCLRTPTGGSSRQTLLIVEGENIRSRLISTREAARLMGLDDSYILPVRYNDAYHLTGDGVAVPVARHLAAHLFEPLLGLRKADVAA